MDHEQQHELVLTLQLLKQLKTRLENWVDDGKLEQHRIDQQNWVEKMTQRFRA